MDPLKRSHLHQVAHLHLRLSATHCPWFDDVGRHCCRHGRCLRQGINFRRDLVHPR